jgi:threonine dehydratase
MPVPEETVRLAAIRAAQERIADVLHRTPVISSASVNAELGAALWFKAENLQKTGSFKARGALNRIRHAHETSEPPGVVTASSGNHGQAVAFAARQVGWPARVVMPVDASPAKVEAARAYGAAVEFCGTTSRERLARAASLAEEDGWLLVPPYDDVDVLAGQGTIGLEILDQVDGVDTVLVPIGGGGLISGIASAVKAVNPKVRVVGVEPAGACATYLSRQAGRRIELPAGLTVADGLRTVIPGAITFPIIQALVDDIVTVSDDEILAAMRVLASRLKLVVEPSGACAAAYALRVPSPMAGRRAVVVLSGGNVDLAALARFLAPPA